MNQKLLLTCVAVIGVVAVGLATVVPGTPLSIVNNGVSRVTIHATWWRLCLWPSNTFIGDAQDVAIEVMNLVVTNLLASPGRSLAAVALLLACFIVAALGSACVAASTFAMVWCAARLLPRRYLRRARYENP